MLNSNLFKQHDTSKKRDEAITMLTMIVGRVGRHPTIALSAKVNFVIGLFMAVTMVTENQDNKNVYP